MNLPAIGPAAGTRLLRLQHPPWAAALASPALAPSLAAIFLAGSLALLRESRPGRKAKRALRFDR